MPDFNLISVAVLAPLEGPLTYSVSEDLKDKIQPGLRVIVPLGRRSVVGIVLGKEKNPPGLTYKPLEGILEEEPAFSPSQIEFLQWASDYYLAPLGEMFRTALPAGLARAKKTAPRKKKEEPTQTPPLPPPPLELTPAQQKIVDQISPGSFNVHLIHGITGSGKTEVYLKCLEKVLEKGKQAICLVPEIGLTPQTLHRYSQRFGDRVGIYHSDLNDTERLHIWESCRKGEISLLIGTRSALFSPFRNLGLLVVDEEQDASYKQEDRVRYNARDLAIVRAKIEKIPVLLGSATPSVETYAKAQSGKFIYHELTERFGGAELPKVEVVDLRGGQGGISLFSPRLLEEIEINLARKEQTLIFLNRRGFSHFLLCEDCGLTPDCPNCEITLTYHRKNSKLLCHYCDHAESPPDACPSCHGKNWLFVGSGTEKIEEEIQKIFPQARIGRMDRDTTARKGAHGAILKKLQNRELDILIGTQMIAKGHDYPHVTLVGILLADSSLHLPDFRAGEQTFQLITQVAGRAGRASLPGRVILQTFNPEHDSLRAATEHRIHEFYRRELGFREELGYPPFQRLIALRLQGTRQEKVKKGISRLHEILEGLQKEKRLNAQLLGPAPCLVEKVRNFYRWQILLKIMPTRSLQPVLKENILVTQKDWLPPGLRLAVDVDPMHVT